MALIKNAKEMYDLCNKLVREQKLCEKCQYNLTKKVMIRLKRQGFSNVRKWLEKEYKNLFCDACEKELKEMFMPFIIKEIKTGRR